ncbi:MAG: NAD-dependent epimerase/dehydratase family protein [Proteobacteria bacterium]|nr:NAD-dependent epimerase/dehydratase family protein [Pseudomonadota bacterium]
MTVLVTGATGAIGPHVIHALHQAGYWIRTFSFDAPTAGIFPSDVNVVIGDVTDQKAVESAMRGPGMGDVQISILLTSVRHGLIVGSHFKT